MKKHGFLTLGIESSCDETAAAVVEDGRTLLSNVISSQIDIHTKFGGVVPEIASRNHLLNVNRVIAEALQEAGDLKIEDMDLIAVTAGPGLIGALVIGVAAAKAASLAGGVPLVGVNHMIGHVSSNFLTYPALEPPFISLIVSGGHTSLVRMTGHAACRLLGSTRDDAAGEAFDKVARVIGLGYPGGPKIDTAAKKGDPQAVHFKRVTLQKDSLDFSFSGLKTEALNYINRERSKGKTISVPDIAAGFQEAVVDVLTEKAVQALRQYGEERLVLAGGVAANSRLREVLSARCAKEGIALYLPEPVLCTDNGAMIACAGYYQYMAQGADDLTLDAVANLAF